MGAYEGTNQATLARVKKHLADHFFSPGEEDHPDEAKDKQESREALERARTFGPVLEVLQRACIDLPTAMNEVLDALELPLSDDDIIQYFERGGGWDT